MNVTRKGDLGLSRFTEMTLLSNWKVVLGYSVLDKHKGESSTPLTPLLSISLNRFQSLSLHRHTLGVKISKVKIDKIKWRGLSTLYLLPGVESWGVWKSFRTTSPITKFFGLLDSKRPSKPYSTHSPLSTPLSHLWDPTRRNPYRTSGH